MSRFAALLDACALVPVAQADTLLRLAEAGIYRPLWSKRILDEMTTAIIEAQSPDAFLLNQLDLDPRLVMRTIAAQAADARRPPMTPRELLEILARCSATGFAEEAAHQLWRLRDD